MLLFNRMDQLDWRHASLFRLSASLSGSVCWFMFSLPERVCVCVCALWLVGSSSIISSSISLSVGRVSRLVTSASVCWAFVLTWSVALVRSARDRPDSRRWRASRGPRRRCSRSLREDGSAASGAVGCIVRWWPLLFSRPPARPLTPTPPVSPLSFSITAPGSAMFGTESSCK